MNLYPYVPRMKPELDQVKADFFNILDKAPWEAFAVRQAVRQGKIDGKSYFGDCCCIKGIIARNVGLDLRPNLSDIRTINISNSKTFQNSYGIGLSASHSPLEQYIMHIRPGETPENNPECKQLLEWLDEYITGLKAKQSASIQSAVEAGLDAALASSCVLTVEQDEETLAEAGLVVL